jgi:hypothetical protein
VGTGTIAHTGRITPAGEAGVNNLTQRLDSAFVTRETQLEEFTMFASILRRPTRKAESRVRWGVAAWLIGWALLGGRMIWGAVSPVFITDRAPANQTVASALAPDSDASEQTGLKFRKKNIEDIVEGDRVWTRDDKTGEESARRVVRTFQRTADHLRILRIRSSAGEEQEIRTTDEHPFNVDAIGWVPAGELTVGQILLQPDGRHSGLVESWREERPAGVPVFNFEVEDAHTYFVAANAEEMSVLVHNACDMHHGTPREVIKRAPAYIDRSAIQGVRGRPNRVAVERNAHQSAHNGGANGGQPRYNAEFKARLREIENRNGRLTEQDYWEVRARMLWEYFGIQE